MTTASQQRKLAGGAWFPVKLYEESIKLPRAVRPLSAETKARVDTAGDGSRFAPLARITVRAPKKTPDDERELRLVIEDPGWSEAVKLRPGQTEQARSLAQRTNLAARNLANAQATRAARMKAADEQLTAAVNRGESSIAAAQETVSTARAATDNLNEARAALVTTFLYTSNPRVSKRAQRALEHAGRLLDRAKTQQGGRDTMVAGDDDDRR